MYDYIYKCIYMVLIWIVPECYSPFDTNRKSHYFYMCSSIKWFPGATSISKRFRKHHHHQKPEQNQNIPGARIWRRNAWYMSCGHEEGTLATHLYTPYFILHIWERTWHFRSQGVCDKKDYRFYTNIVKLCEW